MKLLEQVRAKMRLLHYLWDTEQCYVRWIERYIHFHKQGTVWRHPDAMGVMEIELFLTHLARDRHVSSSTQNQAFSALLFLYQKVLDIPLERIDAMRAKRTRRMPVVLSRDEVKQLLTSLQGLETREPYSLMARLMYGTGMRIMECCRLRVKDVDFQRMQLMVRQGKGDKDRAVPFPSSVQEELRERVQSRSRLHELLGHSDVSTTMIYTHVLQRGACGVVSPLDRL